MFGEKKVFLRKNFKHYFVKNKPEYAIRRIWPLALCLENFTDYFPDSWRDTRTVCRDYFYRVCATLSWSWLDDLVQGTERAIQQAKDERRLMKAAVVDYVEPNAEWTERIMNTPTYNMPGMLSILFEDLDANLDESG